jgi:hypothetical protein
MTTNFDNRRRAFADVVTIDAWHDDFSGETSKVDLHADVVFGTARVGGEPEAPVRFRLSVKRAEVVVVVPELEPVTVDRKSVSRDAPELEGRLTEVIEQTVRVSAKGSASADASLARLNASASAEAAAEGGLMASKKLELSATFQLILVTQSKTDEGHYRWLLEAGRSGILKGRAWDAVKQPRLKLIDCRKDRSKGIPPTVRVEVCCRREDLAIEDLQIKDEKLWETVKTRVGFNNRMAAAESYIRDRLAEEGLEVKNITDIFGHITLGSATAQTV